MYDTGIPVAALVTAIIWLITFVAAVTVGLIANFKMGKVVNIAKGLLIGLACWVVFSIVLALAAIYGAGPIAGAIGNLAMAYVFWNSPTKEEYLKILQTKYNKRNIMMNKTQPDTEEEKS